MRGRLVVIMMMLMIGCGVLFYRRGKRSESDFFWPAGATLVVAGFFGVRHPYGGGYPHVGDGRYLQTRPDGNLVCLFLGLVRH